MLMVMRWKVGACDLCNGFALERVMKGFAVSNGGTNKDPLSVLIGKREKNSTKQ